MFEEFYPVQIDSSLEEQEGRATTVTKVPFSVDNGYATRSMPEAGEPVLKIERGEVSSTGFEIDVLLGEGVAYYTVTRTRSETRGSVFEWVLSKL